MKRVIYLCMFLLTAQLSAAPITQYQISSISDNLITLSNGTVLNVSPINMLTLQGWHTSDFVELMSLNVGLAIAPPIQTGSNVTVLPPVFILSNASQNNEQIAVWMHTVPGFSNSDTPVITDIDLTNRLIQLSDATVWSYPPKDQAAVAFWNLGDLIMLGANGLYTNTPTYGAILFNTRLQSIVNALEQ
ncbi:MAG: hypothetical protein K2P51_06750 [Rhabdochlamydiaceae bacterium]|nr:hypothetical protein [Rhabdochlamydiaceae bacterium]